MNAGSCRWGSDGDRLDYDRLAETLVPYAKDLGFTHIELLPISEHPFTGSWGYQPLGLFAPTNRFGPPEAFARFVDRCHQEGIGLIVGWVPAHFPINYFPENHQLFPLWPQWPPEWAIALASSTVYVLFVPTGLAFFDAVWCRARRGGFGGSEENRLELQSII